MKTFYACFYISGKDKSFNSYGVVRFNVQDRECATARLFSGKVDGLSEKVRGVCKQEISEIRLGVFAYESEDEIQRLNYAFLGMFDLN